MQFEAQHQHYQSRYPNASMSVIKSGDQPVGRLYVAELADEIRIIDITILPEHRNQGIGTKFVKDVLQTGADRRKPVQIYVENYNPSAAVFLAARFRAGLRTGRSRFMAMGKRASVKTA